MRITGKELANKLHLSATAVSMALNNKPGVSTETKRLIIAEAEKYGYDFSRLSVNRNHNNEIFCVIYRTHNAILNYAPIFSDLTDGIEQHCRDNGFRLKIVQIYERIDDLNKCIEELRMSNCAGIILLGTEITSAICSQFLPLSIPLVLLDSYFDSINCNSVVINNEQGAYLATNFLIDQTGSQPGHLRSSYSIPNFTQRRLGFEHSIKEHGLSIGKSLSHELTPSIDGAYQDMMELLESGNALSRCYFADNDLIAIGAIRAIQEYGLNVPEDIAIMGFDNISEGKIIQPALTTIDISRKFMGQMAVDQLIRHIKNPIPHTVKLDISTSIVKRRSV